MSDENVERVRRGIDAFNRRDFDAALAMLSDEVVWDRFLSRTESDSPVIRGKAEVRAQWESQVEAVDLRVEIDELVDLGDRVAATTRMLVRGSGSDISLDEPVTWTWTFDDTGVASTVQFFASLDDAISATN